MCISHKTIFIPPSKIIAYLRGLCNIRLYFISEKGYNDTVNIKNIITTKKIIVVIECVFKTAYFTEENMRAIITVIGKDAVGILARVSDACAKTNVNIVEVTQSVLQDMFAMIMLVEIDKASVGFEELRERLNEVGDATNTKIHIMHEDIFNSMHRI